MKRIIAFLATLILGGAMAVAVSTPAQAAWSSCYPGNVCFFVNTGGGGPLLAYAAPATSARIAMPNGWNDVTSSVYNRSGVSITVCENNPCYPGDILVITNGAQVSWNTWFSWNDEISAFYRTPT